MSRRAALAWVALPTAVLLAVHAGLTLLTDVRTAELLADPAELVGFPAWYGAFSHLAVLLWTSTAAICLFASRVGRRGEVARFLLASGLLSSVLALDDLFQLHEDVVPTHLGLAEPWVVAVEIAIALWIGVRFSDAILEGELWLLVLALGSLGASVLIDLWGPSGVDLVYEDGLKLLGIGAWLGYHAGLAAAVVATPVEAPDGGVP